MSELPAFHLLEFIPFRILRLAAKVGEPFSVIFRERFGFDLPEWRVLSTVAQTSGCTARDVAEQTGMHKTRVSRAIADLTELDLLQRLFGKEDRREVELRLTAKGRRVYRAAVELALQREREIMSALSPAELRRLEKLVRKLEDSLGLRHAGSDSAGARDGRP